MSDSFVLSLKELSRDLLFISRTTGHKPGRAYHPIIDTLRISVENGLATVTFYDFETMVRVRLTASGDDAEFVVGFGDLVNAIKATGAVDTGTFSVDGQLVSIASGGMFVAVPLVVGDLPTLPVVDGEAALVVSGADFAQVATTTAVAVGVDDRLPMLAGIRLESDGDLVHAVSTDRFKLAVAEMAGASAEFATLLPGRAFAAVGKRAVKDQAVSLIVGNLEQDRSVRIDTDDTTTIVRVLDYEFPKWHVLIPKDEVLTTSFDVDGQALAKRMQALSASAMHVRLSISDGRVVASGLNQTSEAISTFEIDAGNTIWDMPDPIHFDAKRFAQALTAIPRGVKVRIQMSTPTRPILFSWPNNTVLLMPVRFPR